MTIQFCKIKGSSLSLLSFIFIMFTCLFISSFCKPTFKTSPDYKYYTGYSNPTAIKISSSDDVVMIGYNNGSVIIYGINQFYYCTCYGHTNKIVDIE